jgi:hypothetical protein
MATPSGMMASGEEETSFALEKTICEVEENLHDLSRLKSCELRGAAVIDCHLGPVEAVTIIICINTSHSQYGLTYT